MTFGLITKILNSIYVIMIFSKIRTVIDSKMAKFADIEHHNYGKYRCKQILSGFTCSWIIGSVVMLQIVYLAPQGYKFLLFRLKRSNTATLPVARDLVYSYEHYRNRFHLLGSLLQTFPSLIDE